MPTIECSADTIYVVRCACGSVWARVHVRAYLSVEWAIWLPMECDGWAMSIKTCTAIGFSFAIIDGSIWKSIGFYVAVYGHISTNGSKSSSTISFSMCVSRSLEFQDHDSPFNQCRILCAKWCVPTFMVIVHFGEVFSAIDRYINSVNEHTPFTCKRISSGRNMCEFVSRFVNEVSISFGFGHKFRRKIMNYIDIRTHQNSRNRHLNNSRNFLYYNIHVNICLELSAIHLQFTTHIHAERLASKYSHLQMKINFTRNEIHSNHYLYIFSLFNCRCWA